MKHKIKYICKGAINENSLEAFKSSSHEMSWENIKSLKNLNYAYSCLPETMSILYNQSFPKLKNTANSKKNSKPWITKSM